MSEKNIISFKLKQKKYLQNECKHNNILIDRGKWLLECEDCGEWIDPIWWVSELARKQMSSEYKLDQLNKKYTEIKNKLTTRIKTKCDHCGKMTSIKGL